MQPHVAVGSGGEGSQHFCAYSRCKPRPSSPVQKGVQQGKGQAPGEGELPRAKGAVRTGLDAQQTTPPFSQSFSPDSPTSLTPSSVLSVILVTKLLSSSLCPAFSSCWSGGYQLRRGHRMELLRLFLPVCGLQSVRRPSHSGPHAGFRPGPHHPFSPPPARLPAVLPLW